MLIDPLSKDGAAGRKIWTKKNHFLDRISIEKANCMGPCQGHLTAAHSPLPLSSWIRAIQVSPFAFFALSYFCNDVVIFQCSYFAWALPDDALGGLGRGGGCVNQ